MTDGLRRRTVIADDGQEALFDIPMDWETHWWGMPSFEHGDARPQYKITVNFMTREDVLEFARRLGVKLGAQSDTVWFPPENLDQPKEWAYVEAD